MMFRKTALFGALIVGFCAGRLFAAQINSTWIGGPDGQWETATNWDPPIVPENGVNTFAVIINGGSVELTADHTIDSLDTYDQVELQRWMLRPVVLTVSSSFTNHGELDTPDTTRLYIYGPLVNETDAEIDIVSEELEVYGVVGIQNAGRVHIDADAEFTSTESDVDNTGALDMFGGVASAAQTFMNHTGGIIQGHGAAGGQQFINAGLVESIGGTLQIYCETFSNTGTLKNSPGASIRTRIGPSDQSNEGMIEVYSEGAVAFDCNLTNEPNGVIKLLDGTLAATVLTQKAGATFEGFGGITGDVVIEPNSVNEPDSAIWLTGPTNIMGNVTVSPGAILRISDGQTLITGQTVNNGTIELIGGTVIFQGGYSGNGTISVMAGTDRNHFDVNSDGSVDLEDFTDFIENWLWKASWY